MKYGLSVFLTDVYPLVVALVALYYGVQVIVKLAKNKPVVMICSGREVAVFCLVATTLVLFYLHLQLRWILAGFENSAALEVFWAINEGAIWLLIIWILRRIAKKV